jgi:polyisoprenoid-binding protein YceI
LTVRDVTRPATFDVNARLAGDTLSGTATTQIKMSDFGIEPPNFANTLTVADEFRIEVQFVAKG